jgi:hypothetical protein
VDSGVQEIHILRYQPQSLATRLLLLLQVKRFHAFALSSADFTKTVAMAPQVSQIKAFHRTGIAAFQLGRTYCIQAGIVFRLISSIEMLRATPRKQRQPTTWALSRRRCRRSAE